MRVQLARVFRKYVSPDTPVKMVGQRMQAQRVCDQFRKRFRPICEVRDAFASRPIPDGLAAKGRK